MTSPIINLAQRAYNSELTIEEINNATKDQLNNDKDKYGATCLYWACARCSIKLVEAILDKGVDIDGLSQGNATALMSATCCQKWAIVHLLLQRGANATLVNRFDNNALHYAVENVVPDDVIKVLIDAGADPKGQDRHGKTPSDIAREKNHHRTAAFIEQYGMAPIKSANLVV
jgi:ankyrin repeat protein